jgi:uncharacterized protein
LYFTNESSKLSHQSNPFRLNVGFLTNVSLGESRDFQFEITAYHFDPDLDLRDLNGSARFTRTANGILVQAKFTADYPADCVRCLTEFKFPLRATFTELFAFSRDSMTESELLFPENGYINLAPLVREYMILAKPISPICKVECKGLCPICGENLNESQCNHGDDSIDSRFDILKKLIDK